MTAAVSGGAGGDTSSDPGEPRADKAGAAAGAGRSNWLVIS